MLRGNGSRKLARIISRHLKETNLAPSASEVWANRGFSTVLSHAQFTPASGTPFQYKRSIEAPSAVLVRGFSVSGVAQEAEPQQAGDTQELTSSIAGAGC